MGERGTAASCSCENCVHACKTNPGYMTPQEARKAIDAGFGGELMLDWLGVSFRDKIEKTIYVLCPASLHNKGELAPEMPSSFLKSFNWCRGRCVLLTKDNRCSIHDSEFKPAECRAAFCEDEDDGVKEHIRIGKMWDSEEGKAIVAEWRQANHCYSEVYE